MVRLMEEREAGRVFGEVAETYDRVRQPYPEELFGDVLDYAGDARTALEVGAGTGRATAGFATRGLTVTAIEPDAEMAAILARRASGDTDRALHVRAVPARRALRPGIQRRGLALDEARRRVVERLTGLFGDDVPMAIDTTVLLARRVDGPGR
jgi:SAM-dependent methyltransferase